MWCRTCGEEVEERSWHIFGECVFGKRVWDLVYRWLDYERVRGSSVEELFGNHCLVKCGGDKQVWIMLWQVTVWSIWYARNQFLFTNEKQLLCAYWKRFNFLAGRG